MCKKGKSDFGRMIRSLLQEVEFILRSKGNELNSENGCARRGKGGEVHHGRKTGRRTGTSVLFGGRDMWGNSGDPRRLE